MARQLEFPGGTVAHEEAGTGPLAVCVPDMGDLRSTYRFSTTLPAAPGYRVVSLDVRDYSVGAIARDIVALIEALGSGPAHVLGNSMSAGAAVVNAGRRPDLVRSLTLTAPFFRDVIPAWATVALFGPLLGGPWRSAIGIGICAQRFRRAFPPIMPMRRYGAIAISRKPAVSMRSGAWRSPRNALRRNVSPTSKLRFSS